MNKDVILKKYGLEKDWGKGTGVKDLNMGRYVQFVKLPSGQISYFELKTDPMSVEDVKSQITMLLIEV